MRAVWCQSAAGLATNGGGQIFMPFINLFPLNRRADRLINPARYATIKQIEFVET